MSSIEEVGRTLRTAIEAVDDCLLKVLTAQKVISKAALGLQEYGILIGLERISGPREGLQNAIAEALHGRRLLNSYLETIGLSPAGSPPIEGGPLVEAGQTVDRAPEAGDMSVDGSSDSYDDSDATDSVNPFLQHGEEALEDNAYPDEGVVDALSFHGFVPEYTSDELSRVDAVPDGAQDVSELTSKGEFDLELAADELAKLLTTSTEVIFARKALEAADAKYEKDRTSIEACSQRDAALKRYIGKLQEALGDRRGPVREGLDRAQRIVDSPDATSSAKDFITKGLLLIGVAVLASVAAGAIGALVVKEIVWKEVIKSAIGAFVTGMATLWAEQAWRRK